MSISHTILRLIPYALLLGGSFWLHENYNVLKDIPSPVIAMAPYVICLLGGGFAWFFRRGNIAIAFIYTAFCFYVLNGFDSNILIFVGLSILLPLNIWLLAFWVDRGVLTSSGIAKFSFIAAQVLILFLMAYAENGKYAQESLSILAYQKGNLALPFKTQLPFFSLVLFSLTTLWFTARIFWKSLPIDTGWLAFLFGIALGLWFPNHMELFFSAALSNLVLAVIQDSYRMAFLDELTGLPGRRALMSDMKKLGSRYVIAMADIDHFKKFNDTYGHDVGDQVLRMVASNLDKVTGGARAYRYGGEEFTLVFPNKSVEEAIPHIEKVRERVEKASFTLRGQDRPKKKPKTTTGKSSGQTVRVTSSFGAAERTKETAEPMAVMKQADQALYRAKKAGRNCVSK